MVVACEGGPSYRYDRVINTCYSVKEIRRSWYAAQLHCQSEKAWLLDLSDHQVASHLMNNFNNYHDPCRWNICWIFKSIFKYMPIYISFGIFRLYLIVYSDKCFMLQLKFTSTLSKLLIIFSLGELSIQDAKLKTLQSIKHSFEIMISLIYFAYYWLIFTFPVSLPAIPLGIDFVL